MLDGLWTAEFRTGMSTGSGTVIFKDGKVAGGDAGFYYIGNYTLDQENLNGQVKIQRFKQGSVSVFGPLVSDTLKISGTVLGTTMNLSGHLASNPNALITIQAVKRESF
jgi:hypothetical protein